MDGMWAESQLDQLRWGAGNTTNFSTVSATAQTEMGSTKVQAASNEQLLPLSLQNYRRGESKPSQPTFSVNAKENLYKLRAGPVPITFICSQPVTDAYCGKNQCSLVMKCAKGIFLY